MTVATICKEWLEVWSGIPKGEQQPRWFVDYCTHDGKATVADCPNEWFARNAAVVWQLPILPSIDLASAGAAE